VASLVVRKRRLGEILTDAGELTQEQLNYALTEQKKDGNKKRLGEVLIDLKFMTERQILKTLEKQLAVPYVFLGDFEIMPEAVGAVPIFLAERYTLIPVKKEGNRLTIAMNDPTNFYAIDDVRMVTGCDIAVVIAEKQEILNAINNYYGISGRAGDAMGKLAKESSLHQEQENVSNIVEATNDDAPVIKIINSIIEQGIRDKASDIHIEPLATETRVRYRIDGVLHKAASFPLASHSALVSRVKIMANLDIAEKRVPQDGRIKLTQGGNEIDLRISTLPTILGEKIVMRILDKGAAMIKLANLGFSAENMKLFQHMYNASYGIVLVTGPTGSGKSTTLYSVLSEINDPSKNIITVEDPVEYTMTGVNQVAVNVKAGLTFANGLRSILRQDPNIIMVGEIRDVETAQIAINAALTGHLVFSTLHTNDAAGAITRLVDMGVEPFLIVSSLRGVLAQRLVRCICPDCKEEYSPAPDDPERAYLGIGPQEPVKLYKGKGCSHCSFTGYSGRMAIHEVLPFNDHMQTLVMHGATDSEIFDEARKSGTTSMKEDGIRKVLEGKTTVSELLRVAYT
jgi:type IV pilus assembly protein PilB